MISIFSSHYSDQKSKRLQEIAASLYQTYNQVELLALRIESVDPQILSQLSGRGFVNRDILETILGNLLELVAPGSHNAVALTKLKSTFRQSLEEMVDQLYAMVVQSFLAVGDADVAEEMSVATTFDFFRRLPKLKERAFWNRFASLKDPAVWDAYLNRKYKKNLDPHDCEFGKSDSLAEVNIRKRIDQSILERNPHSYNRFLAESNFQQAFDYQMQLVMSSYPGWRVQFYHDVAHSLATSSVGSVPLLPRVISELGGRYYQADLHPETQIGDANFFDHTHRGITTGQTGVIGSGCVIYPCTLGGLSVKNQARHPTIGDFVQISTDVGIFGRVDIGNYSVIGANTEIYGLIQVGREVRIGSSVVIGTVKPGATANRSEVQPGSIRIGDQVRIGDGAVIENSVSSDLIIPHNSTIPTRSYVINDGEGTPKFVS
ncbi:MAG: hypothetical protein VX830_00870 [Candidatus Poribacteria bacterium]|nr:hypothetical protein [Candidatus Poribacteria bacterium]